MKKDALMAMGLTEELAEKAASAFGEELKGFVPKSRFDEVLEERNGLRAAETEARQRLAELDRTAGEREELRRRVEELEAEAVRREEAHAAALQTAALDSAIRQAMPDAHDAALAAGFIDRDGLCADERGNVPGLAERIDALRAEKPFLFRPAASAGFTVGAYPAQGTAASGGGPTMRETITRHFQAQRG